MNEKNKAKSSKKNKTLYKVKWSKKTGAFLIIILILLAVLIINTVVKNVKFDKINIIDEVNLIFNNKVNDNLTDIKSVNDLTTIDEVFVGQHLKFGKYEQDGNTRNGKEVIEWRVLAVQDGRALLISEKLLDFMPYHDKVEEVTWEDCSLREWMNGTFIRKAFDYNEREKIVKTTVSNSDNPEYSTQGGNDTTDKIFALSIDEVELYFVSESDRITYMTEYTKSKVEKRETIYLYLDTDTGAGSWWLRTPGKNNYYAVRVDPHYGYIDWENQFVFFDDLICVRPAIWIEI